MSRKDLTSDYWSSRYQADQIGWDMGQVSPPIAHYFQSVSIPKNTQILIPGAGNAHEASFLWEMGFTNVYVLDFAEEPLCNLLSRTEGFPKDQAIVGDILEHNGRYDLIVEQTLFCALDPLLREDYVSKCSELLSDDGLLIGVLFNRQFDSGPPFGGSKEEYEDLYSRFFSDVKMEECYNSYEPRQGSELFIRCKK